MLIKIFLALILFCTTAYAQTVSPQTPDLQRGELLYENHCSGCHEDQVHIREKHIANTLGDVNKQVARWSSELRLEWSASDIQDVTHFLYKRYYQKQAKN
ncbi:MAG: cytochrome C [Thiothrix sp.]|nr:MAG: cytochrome C [Thiothrix sp.]